MTALEGLASSSRCTAFTLRPTVTATGRRARHTRGHSNNVASTLGSGGHSNNPLDETLVASTLSSGGDQGSAIPGRHKEDDENLVVGSSIDEGQARPLRQRATGYRMDIESENFEVSINGSDVQTSELPDALSTDQYVGKGDFVVAGAQRASDGHHGHSSPRGDGGDNLVAQTFDRSTRRRPRARAVTARCYRERRSREHGRASLDPAGVRASQGWPTMDALRH